MKKLLEWSGPGGKVEIVPALFAPLDFELIALVILLGFGVKNYLTYELSKVMSTCDLRQTSYSY